MESRFDSPFQQRLHNAEIHPGKEGWEEMQLLLDNDSSHTHHLFALNTSGWLLCVLLILSSGNWLSPRFFHHSDLRFARAIRTSAPHITTPSHPQQSSHPLEATYKKTSSAPDFPTPLAAASKSSPSAIASSLPAQTTAAEHMSILPFSSLQSTSAYLADESPRSFRPFSRRKKIPVGWSISAQTTWEATSHNGQWSSLPAHRSGLLLHLRLGRKIELISGFLSGKISIRGHYTGPVSGMSCRYSSDINEAIIPTGMLWIPVQKGRFAFTLSAGVQHHIKLQEDTRLFFTDGQTITWNNSFQSETNESPQASKADLPSADNLSLGSKHRYYLSGWASSGMRIHLHSILWLNADVVCTFRPGLQGISGNIWGTGAQLGLTARF